MGKFCSNCGSELKVNADVCLNCGVMVKTEKYNNYIVNNKPKVPGKGMSIAGMILGIVACFWGIMSLLALQ